MNKFMIVATLFLSLSVSLIANAGVSGNWTGFGYWKFKGQGEGVRCMPMQMKWSEGDDFISLDGGYFDCGIVAQDLGSDRWKVKDGQIYDHQDQVIGSYDGQNLEMITASPNEKTQISIKIKREANHIDYEEIWFNQYEKVYVITGRLFTSQ